MSYLFIVNNIKNIVEPTVECLMAEPFKTIWERDKSEGKILAKKELSYIEYSVSIKKTNPFLNYKSDKDNDEKSKKIKLYLDIPPSWKPDELVKKGMEKLKLFQDSQSKYIEYSNLQKAMLKEIKEIFEDSEGFLKKTDEKGKPLYKMTDMLNAINSLEKGINQSNVYDNIIFKELDGVQFSENIDNNPFEK